MNIRVRSFAESVGYPLLLWWKEGLKIYLSDTWNLIELINYACFLSWCVTTTTRTILSPYGVAWRVG